MKHSWILLSCFAILAACAQEKNSTNETMDKKMITVSGVAQNGKGNALLVVEDSTVYYIEGMDFWETIIVGRKIEITGVLQLETMSEGGLKNEQGEYKQGVADEKRILTNVKWKRIQ
jgi:hypothetical protein